MEVDTAAVHAGGAALLEGTGQADVLWEADRGAGPERDDHGVRTADGAGIPVERKGRLGVASPAPVTIVNPLVFARVASEPCLFLCCLYARQARAIIKQISR